MLISINESPKYKDANENQKAIAMLPELITFLGNV